MPEEFYMDTSAVQGIAKKLDEIGQFLNTINKRLNDCMVLLDSTAFIGKVGGAALQRQIKILQPFVKKTADGCLELSSEVDAAVKAAINKDDHGSTRFYR
jgi:hypothetical protein